MTSEPKAKPVPNPSRGVNHRSTGSGPVHEIRTKANLTQKEFAEKTGLSERTVRNCEASGNWPASRLAQDAVLRFAREHGIEIECSTII